MTKLVKLFIQTDKALYDGRLIVGNKNHGTRILKGIQHIQHDQSKRPKLCQGSIKDKDDGPGRITFTSLVNLENVLPIVFNFDFNGDYSDGQELHGTYQPVIFDHFGPGDKANATFNTITDEQEITDALGILEKGFAETADLPRIMEAQGRKFEAEVEKIFGRKSRFVMPSLQEILQINNTKL